jgi:hypothetical protein
MIDIKKKLQIVFERKIVVLLLLSLIINIVLLFFIDGPIWGLLCITLFFIILSITLTLTIENSYRKITNRYIRSILMVAVCIMFVFSFSNYMTFMTHLKADSNEQQLHEIVNGLIEDKISDEAKTKSILEWFNSKDNNIYNNYQLTKKGTPGFGGPIRFFFGEPYIGIRVFNDRDSLWIMTSRYGHCGEYGLLFRDMADAAGLNVRKVTCSGEDHVWNEVFINSSWVVIDATRVGNSGDNGYDVSNDFMERKVAGDRNTQDGNVSYVVAEYLNGTTVDVTDRYTQVVNLSIIALDESGNICPYVELKVISNNRYNNTDTKYDLQTNEHGMCNFTIGGGNYTFQSKSNEFIPLFNQSTIILYEDSSTNNLTFVLKSHWTKNNTLVYGILLIAIFIILLCVLQISQKLRNRKIIKF